MMAVEEEVPDAVAGVELVLWVTSPTLQLLHLSSHDQSAGSSFFTVFTGTSGMGHISFFEFGTWSID